MTKNKKRIKVTEWSAPQWDSKLILKGSANKTHPLAAEYNNDRSEFMSAQEKTMYESEYNSLIEFQG